MVRFNGIPARCKAPMCSDVYIRIGPEVRTESGNSVRASACSNGIREREFANASCRTSGVARATAQLSITMSNTTAESINGATLGINFRAKLSSQRRKQRY